MKPHPALANKHKPAFGRCQERLRTPAFDDDRLAEIFAREVLSFLVGREILSPEWAERILSWRHTGFNVHGGRGPGALSRGSISAALARG